MSYQNITNGVFLRKANPLTRFALLVICEHVEEHKGRSYDVSKKMLTPFLFDRTMVGC